MASQGVYINSRKNIFSEFTDNFVILYTHIPRVDILRKFFLSLKNYSVYTFLEYMFIKDSNNILDIHPKSHLKMYTDSGNILISANFYGRKFDYLYTHSLPFGPSHILGIALNKIKLKKYYDLKDDFELRNLNLNSFCDFLFFFYITPRPQAKDFSVLIWSGVEMGWMYYSNGTYTIHKLDKINFPEFPDFSELGATSLNIPYRPSCFATQESTLNKYIQLHELIPPELQSELGLDPLDFFKIDPYSTASLQNIVYPYCLKNIKQI